MEGFDLINIPRRLSKHGGLIIYVKNTFSYSLLDLIPESDVFEGVLITIQNKQNPSVKYIIGGIYRPPHDKVSELEQFIDEFNLITQTFEELNYRAYLCGDYNIDLLQIDNSDKINLLYQNLTMSGFFPKITLPTRLSETACTLIDIVITNNIKCNHISGVLIRKISDHQINFCMINEKCTAMNSKRKLVEVEQCNEQTIEKFQNYLI